MLLEPALCPICDFPVGKTKCSVCEAPIEWIGPSTAVLKRPDSYYQDLARRLDEQEL
jgi:hypothetical protein